MPRNTLALFIAVFMMAWANVAAAFTGSLESRIAAEPDLMIEFEGFDEDSNEAIGHNRWQSFLDIYLVSDDQDQNLFRYTAVSDEDEQTLGEYISGLTALGISQHNRDEQKAYWINLYNALTIQLVLQHYPIRTIRDIDISPGIFASGPWGKKLVTVEGVDLSLDDIEHRILRPIWQDNRIHYALNCASLGCPDLWPDAFYPNNLEENLDAAAFKFINSPGGVLIEGGRMTISKIYEWYDEDFGGTDEGVIEHLIQYGRKSLDREINRRLGSIKTDYDWNLNVAK